jgi:YcaO-like protein with predicted kinase domain
MVRFTAAAGPEHRDPRPREPDAPTGYSSGTHRLISPEETLTNVRRFFPVMGITRVGNITGLDVIDLPVVAVCRPNSRSVVVSLGKGLDLMAARASGVMESIEAFMAERIIRPLMLGSFNDLRFSHRLIDIDRLPRQERSLYHPDFPILWIEGQELFTRTRVWVPYEMVHTAYTVPVPSGTGCFIATSNGLASGNHLLEAISHGICELIERDADTLLLVHTPEEAALRQIDLQTVEDADCAAALGRLHQAGMSARIWDMTSDIGIAAFKCLITERDKRAARTACSFEGMGCHPDRGIALLRALTESAQSRIAAISGIRDEAEDWGPPRRNDAEPTRKQALLVGEAVRDFVTVPTFEGKSIDADVARELGALRSVGISEVVVVDLTREEFGIPVVRVVIPGLEGPVGMVSSCRLGQRAMNLIDIR